MDNFLDTCIILAKFDFKNKFHKKSEEFIDSNNHLIISVYQERFEIGYLFFRKEKIISESIRYIQIPNYSVDTKNLTPKDILLLKKNIARIKLLEVSEQKLFLFKRDLLLLKHQINSFIKNKIDRRVIPLEKIDLLLVEQIKDKISNTADSNILASAVQEHQENSLVIITNDAKDMKKESLVEILKGTKYSKTPDIKYLF